MNTDDLKQTLAEMLPETLGWNDMFLYWRNVGRRVFDIELLQLCALVEEGLTEDQHRFYYDGLRNLCSLEGIHPYSALWHQRVRVLANTKGITP